VSFIKGKWNPFGGRNGTGGVVAFGQSDFCSVKGLK
jgi:hypothetical protein